MQVRSALFWNVERGFSVVCYTRFNTSSLVSGHRTSPTFKEYPETWVTTNLRRATPQKSKDLITNRSLINDNINEELKEYKILHLLPHLRQTYILQAIYAVAQDLWICYSQSHGYYLDSQKCHRSAVVVHVSTTKSRLFVIRFLQKVPDMGMIYCSTGVTAFFKVTARRTQCGFGG